MECRHGHESRHNCYAYNFGDSCLEAAVAQPLFMKLKLSFMKLVIEN